MNLFYIKAMTYFATAKEMEWLDELAVESGLEIRQMMELAGWQMVTLFDCLSIDKTKKVTVICGKGNKGGDGLCAVRHLINHGWWVQVMMVSKDLKADPAHHLTLLEKMGVKPIYYIDDKSKSKQAILSADVLIDALIGYHLNGAPRGDFAELIKLMNNSGKQIVAYDLPTGVDATTGECFDPCTKADATLTLALPKKIFKTDTGRAQSGEVYLADIGIPKFLYDQVAKDSRPRFEETSDLLIKLS